MGPPSGQSNLSSSINLLHLSVENAPALQLVLEEAKSSNAVTVVFFSSPTVPMCTAFRSHYEGIAAKNPEMNFIEVSDPLFEVDKELSGLEVSEKVHSLPYIRLFRPDGSSETLSLEAKNTFS